MYWGTDKYSLINGIWMSVGWLYGGGASRLFAVPSWQQSVAGSATGRVVPDVSMIGDPNTGFLEGQTQSFPDGNYYDEYRIGGMSVSSPLSRVTRRWPDQLAGHAHGFVNRRSTRRAPACTTTSSRRLRGRRRRLERVLYSARTFGDTLTLNSVPGFDDSTGLGTPTSALPSSLSY
jgi:subtilase family serine protease